MVAVVVVFDVVHIINDVMERTLAWKSEKTKFSQSNYLACNLF